MKTAKAPGRSVISATVCLLAAAASISLHAQSSGGNYTIIGGIYPGAATVSGGTYGVSGWIATSGGGTSSGSDYDLTYGLLGLWVLDVDDVTLNVALTSVNAVRIWWDTTVTGYQLEHSAAVGPHASWTAVPEPTVGNQYTASPTDAGRYFRLRKP